MPPSSCITKQNPVISNRLPMKATGQRCPSSSSSRNSIPACDKSTVTVSTTELSFSSISSSSESFSKLSSKNVPQKTSLNNSNANINDISSSSSSSIVGCNNDQTKKPNKRSQSRTLHAPAALHPQSSLLDITMDESHDDDTSFDHNSPRKSKTTPSPNSKKPHIKHNYQNHASPTSSGDLGSSIMEQTEKNLAAISESMSSSLCANQGDVNNSCTIIPDCSTSDFKSTSRKNTLFGDTLVQNRLLDDFTYILGSNVMPCCEEKTIFSSCFGISSSSASLSQSNGNEFAHAKEDDTVRNRAGESWRARAYRIRKLREERMMKCDEEYSDYSFSNRRQISMERAVGKSHSADGRIGSSNPFRDVKKDLFQGCDGSRNGYGHGCGGGGGTRRPKHEVQSDPLGRMIGDCIDPIAPAKEDAVELEIVWKLQNDLDLCYDSDPGETSFRTSLTGDKNKDPKPVKNPNTPKRFMGRNKSVGNHLKFGKRRRNRYSSLDCHDLSEEKLDLNASFDVHVSFDNDTDDEEEEDTYSYGSIAPSDDHLWLGRARTTAFTEDIGIARNVQNALNSTWTLTWHPVNQIKAQEKKAKVALLKTLGSTTAVSPDLTAQSPRAVCLWFERGNRIRGNNILEPKLMWRDAYHPELSTRRKLNDSITKGPNQICLLSICRILDVKDHIDRHLYPFAKRSCSFLVRTCDDEEYLFETQSEKERDDLVYLWKLVVARLASQAVVGDGDKMVGEFFVPTNYGVP